MANNIIDSIQLSGVTYTIQGSGGGGVPESAFTAYTAATDARIAEDEEVTAAGLNALNEAISGVSGNPTVELTQAEYDALVSAGTVSANTYYIITDATPIDISNYWTSAQTQSAITSAVSGKVDKSAVTSSVTSASTDSEIPTAKAVYDAVGSGGGGGKAIEAGRGISITTGETADTINCTLPISADTGGIYTTSSYPFTSTAPRSYNAVFGNNNVIDVFGGLRRSDFNALFGDNNGVRAEGGSSSSHFIAGSYNNVKGIGNYRNALFGYYNNSQNNSEFGCGQYNVSNKANTRFGDSGNTLFSIGNGTADNARHNAFEIRQNGDIYLSLNGQDVKLQDQLGGGEVSSAITSGDTNAVAGGAVYDKFDEVEQVTAAGLNAVNDKFGGLKLQQITQSAYDALTTKDPSTLYIIVN